MRRNLRTTSAYKLTLMAAVLALVFCVGLASYAQTVSGTVTRGGVPCPDARVILVNNSRLDEGAVMTTRTDANGYYSFTGGIFIGGTCTLTVNAIKAVPVIDQVINITDNEMTANVDLTYGQTPLYDDFSGASVDMNKWELFNGQADETSTDVTAVSTENGMLKLEPSPVRGGIISTAAFPKYGSYEYVLPQTHSGTNQCFCIIKDKVSGLANFVDLQDQSGSATNPYLNGFNDALDSPKFLQSGALPYPYPAKVTVLRTGYYYDIFVNNVWLASTSTWDSINAVDKIPDNAYIYLYGYEASDATTPTIAYFDNIRAGAAVPVTFNTVAEARAAAVDASVTINNVVVTASTSDAFWVENTDRSAGIKVISTAKPAVGQKALISGKIVKQNNEVALQADDISAAGNSSIPAAVAVTGKVAKELDKAGASAQGLFVKVAGKVSETPDNDGTYITGYYLDDGSGIVAGTHKGLYVKLADFVKLPVGSINAGDFLSKEGPMTVFMADSTTPVPSVITTGTLANSSSTFTAYNDIGYLAAYGAAPNITKYSFMNVDYTSNVVPGGLLMDYATGNYVAEGATVSTYGLNEIQWCGGVEELDSTDTDLQKYFADNTDPLNPKWMVNFVGTPSTRTIVGWWEDITFFGLDPNALYEFVGTVERQEAAYYSANILVSINDFADRTYAGSVTATKVDENTINFNASDNSAGNVARWINIKPANGTFRIRTKSTSTGRGYALAAFRLRKQAGVETP
ncbi:MAG: carboxypeptidase-like regulatory domain-containing protein [Armatimonadota bacterium]